MGLGFFGFGVGLLVQVIGGAGAQSPAFVVCYLLGITGIAWAISLRLAVPIPWRRVAVLVVVLVALLLALPAYFSTTTSSGAWRVYLLSVGATLLLSLPLADWRAMQTRNAFDKVLRWVYAVCILAYLLRTLWLMPCAQPMAAEPAGGALNAHMSETWYWISIHFFAVLTAPVLAVNMCLAVVADLVQALKRDSHHDALTQLLNRRGFEEQVDQQRLNGQVTRWAVLLCDLDHFKTINDQFGHAAGDQVLKLASKLLKKWARSHDVVARFGGEEFVLLLADVDLVQATQIAERMREQLAAQHMPVLQDQQVTWSIGVVHLHTLEAVPLARALLRADEAMYTAKRAGRNRVTVLATD